MNADYFRQLYDYNYWAHDQVWQSVINISDEAFFQPTNYSIGSVHRQCYHVMSVEHWWFVFLAEGRLDFLTEDDYQTREAIREKWDAVEAYVRNYLTKLQDDDLMKRVKPDFWDDDEPAITVAEALTQVANHSTDHRAQTLAQLHRLGARTAPQDYLEYLHREVE